MHIVFNYKLVLISASILLIGIACSSSEQMTRNESRPEADTTKAEVENINYEELLTANRSKLSDLHSTQQHDIPEAFLKRDTTDNTFEPDPFDGYRVQILSTREVSLADSISKQYRIWADTLMTSYQPRAYVFFKQPFYKVHIGDFQERERAIKLSDLLKRKYPGAWVVHDRINPSLVPPDTVKVDSLISR